MNRVGNKVAVITGGVIGMGSAICRLLANEGAKIAVTDIRDQDGQRLVNEIRKSGGIADYWHLDTSDETNIKRVFMEISNAFGSIDILVNNAGTSGTNTPTHKITKAEWEKFIIVKVNGVFSCIEQAIPFMKKAGGGSIINLSSIDGNIGATYLLSYRAFKEAIRLVTKFGAIFYAKDKIRVNSIHPGFIWTPFIENQAKKSPKDVSAFKKQFNRRHSKGHVVDPDDIAYGVLYLASDESKSITGSESIINGRYTALASDAEFNQAQKNI